MISSRTRGALAALVVLALHSPLALAETRAPQSVRIAEEHAFAIRLDSAKAARGHVASIDTPDAAFVKVRFDHFSLPRGVVLEVSNVDGTEVYRYSSDKRDGYTVDASLGEDGVTRFSAMSISGPSARLRLVGTPLEAWDKRHGVVVSRYLEGFPEALLEEFQDQGLLAKEGRFSVCGTDDKKQVACYTGTDATAYDRSRPVAKLILSGGGACTAWRVGSGNHMFTNNHCFATASEVAASEVWFNYQSTACTGGTTAAVTKVTGATMLRTDTTLDYTLFTVNNFASLSSFGYLGLDPRVPTTGEEIFIPQHPGGRVKELGVVSDQNGGGRCKVDAGTTNGNGTNTDAGYQCDTEPGSSGSPVIARSSNKVVALHHLGGCMNTGAHVAKIWPQVSTYFGGVVPDGDTGGGGNLPPAPSFTFTTSGLTATFTDASTDADGAIASRAWNFGDGTTSTATNPAKTYAAAGTYNVQLTVTDNGGASSSTTRAVTVGSVPPGQLQNGVAVANLSGATAAQLNFTAAIPAGASNLRFVMSGGTGDADMHVKFGAAPTTTVYDCRPYANGNNETCPFATPQTGTYYVMIRGYSAFSGVSLVATWDTTTNQPSFFENTADYAITDNATVDSPITVAGRTGNASSALKVTVNILHTYKGDLKVDLVAPDGTLYNIHNRTGSSTDNVTGTFTINASSEVANGVWKLRVNDNAAGDVGRIDSWSMQF